MKTQIRLSLAIQAGVLLVYLILVLLLQLGDPVSALVGCLASLVPGVYFALRMLRRANDNDAARWLGYAYRSNFGRWVLTGAIFVLIFASGHSWDPAILFVGFVLVQMSGVLFPFFSKGTVSNGG